MRAGSGGYVRVTMGRTPRVIVLPKVRAPARTVTTKRRAAATPQRAPEARTTFVVLERAAEEAADGGKEGDAEQTEGEVLAVGERAADLFFLT